MERTFLVGAAGFPNRFALWIASVSQNFFALQLEILGRQVRTRWFLILT